MIGDRRAREPGPASPAAFRDQVSRPAPPRAAPPSTGRGAGPGNASGPVRAVAPANGSVPLRSALPTNGTPSPAREAPRGNPQQTGSGRPRSLAAPPAREQAPAPDAQRNGPGYGAARECSARPPRGAAPQGRAVPDPGPSTGAYNPFAFDDGDDEVGPATVVGSSDTRRRPAAPPRPGARNDGPPTQLDVAGRADNGPPTVFDAPARRADPPSPSGRVDPARRTDGASRPVEASGRRSSMPRFDAPRGDGPVTEVDRAPRGRAPAYEGAPRRVDGPATEVDAARGRTGGHRAPGRSGFGTGLRTGRTGATPATSFTGPPPAPARAFPPAPGPSERAPVRPPADQPTELTRDAVDSRTEVAPRRAPARTGDPDHDDYLHRDDDLDHDGPDDDRDLDDLDHGDQDLDDRDPDDAGFDDDLHGLVRASDDDLDLEALDLDDPDDYADELDDAAARPARVWAGVVAQWLAGAVAGAVLWVLFRYLWRGLPVVALAAALLVTAGLVLLVRQLLHDVDRRTTGFAVLVGLLLTASPAVLVLLGR
jgi:hypothetical protein